MAVTLGCTAPGPFDVPWHHDAMTEDLPEVPEVPTVRVVRGEPDAAELAALMAVLGATASAGPPPAATPSTWSQPARALRRSVRPGPDGWRAAARPS